jgi:hypothetical protein
MIKLLQRFFCKHAEYFETMACDAICNKCHKNLGFVEKSRKDPNRKEVGEQRWWK